MSYSVERLSDEPIVVITYHDEMDLDTVLSAWSESLTKATDVEGTIYRISDIRDGKINFVDAMGILKSVQQDTSGSSADSRIHGVFVGSQALANGYAEIMHRLGRDIPFFQTMEQALEYIRLKIEQE